MSSRSFRTLNCGNQRSAKTVSEKALPHWQQKRGKMKITDKMKKKIKEKMNTQDRLIRFVMKKEPGIDGILVTVGLCIIALLLCVVMKDSLQTFIETIVSTMTSEARDILTGGRP